MTIKRCYPVLVGATVRMNQRVSIARLSTNTCNDVTLTKNNDGSVTINGTCTGRCSLSIISVTAAAGDLKQNHVYYLRGLPSAGVTGSAYCGVAGLVVDRGNGGLYKMTYDFTASQMRIDIYEGDVFTNATVYPQYIDLTDYFGSASIADYLYNLEQTTTGAGIAKLREWGFLTGEYIPYNLGSLESVEATAHKMVGFNQFDGELVAGYWDPSTGAFVGGGANWKACKNYIKCVPNTAYAYFATGSENSKGSIVFYDASKNFISAISGGTGAGVSLFTTPSNCRYFTFYLSIAFSENICINLSNPDRNGEYEAYTSQTYELGSDVLRGIFKLDANNQLYADGDRKTADGTITRKYGVVDLGTLNWLYLDFEGHRQFVFNLSPVNYAPPTPLKANAMCDRYEVFTNSEMFNNEKIGIAIHTDGTQILVYDPTYTDIATFKTAMSGVYFVYELATPTTETSTPFQSPQVCYPDGTEEFITENHVPVGHETEYQL